MIDKRVGATAKIMPASRAPTTDRTPHVTTIASQTMPITALNDFPGHDRYEFVVRNGSWEARLTQPPERAGIRYCPELHQQLEGILGPNTVLPQYASGTAGG